MAIDIYKTLFNSYQETRLYHRYITNKHIAPLLESLKKNMTVEIIGRSVLKNPVYGIQIGHGPKKILMWSQMHGNETTTTKAVFDLINTLSDINSFSDKALQACTLYIIPILNPDGADAYTRVNANQIDLNRDAQDLSQPESKLLRQVFERFKPHYCYNLHGQRTIFSAGRTNHPATVSFLAPAQDAACTITDNRKIAMELISTMNSALQIMIPNQVGVYDDAFNLNCVGDTFQSFHVPTILFEAGHYQNDYAREYTRACIYTALLTSITYLIEQAVDGSRYKSYLDIPENEKCFFDIIIRNAKTNPLKGTVADIGILYKETLNKGMVDFVPVIEKIENLDGFYGHREIDANGSEVYDPYHKRLKIGFENVCVIMNNEKISLLVK